MQPIYATLDAGVEAGESAAMVWDLQTRVYGRARVGPAECPPTDPRYHESPCNRTTKLDMEADPEDPTLLWAIEDSERQLVIEEAKRAKLAQRAREYAQGLGCGLLEVAADGNCLPAVVAYLRFGTVQQHPEVRAVMHRVLDQALMEDEEWAGQVSTT